jgi:hypothetical protein
VFSLPEPRPIPGVTMTDIDDKQNRITIGIDMSLKAAKKRRVIEALETAIERLNILTRGRDLGRDTACGAEVNTTL